MMRAAQVLDCIKHKEARSTTTEGGAGETEEHESCESSCAVLSPSLSLQHTNGLGDVWSDALSARGST